MEEGAPSSLNLEFPVIKESLSCFSRAVTSTDLSENCKTFLSILTLTTGILVEIVFVGLELFTEKKPFYLENILSLFLYLIALILLKLRRPFLSSAASLTALTLVLCFHLTKGELYSLYWFPLIPLLSGMLFEFKLFLFFTYAPIFLVSLIFSFQLFDNTYVLFTMETYRLGFSAFTAYLVFSTVAAVYRLILDRFRKELRSLLDRDYLTGVLTRRALFSRLKSVDCEKFLYSVIMADIDNFKQINDTFGHQAGDRVLKELGKIFKENLRRNDFVGRYGGEEFLIVLPDTDKERARFVAEKLRRIIENSYFSFPGKRITVSFGVADCREVNCSKCPEEVIKLADERLYRAKREGKNRVISD